MRLIDHSPRGNVYQTTTPDKIDEYWSDLITLIIQRGGVLDRNVPTCGSSRYIRAIMGELAGGNTVIRIRISDHTKRTFSPEVRPVKSTVDGYRCEVISMSSFVRVKTLIESL
jgi:hypothetical protein